MKVLPLEEVLKHTGPDDCWVVINGTVYDVTSFLAEHPGGQGIILNNTGKDATAIFQMFHPADILINALPASVKVVGRLSESDVQQLKEHPKEHKQTVSSPKDRVEQPPLESIVNVFEFQSIAEKNMTKAGYIYYSTGSEDEVTMEENRRAFSHLWFRPRVLVDVKEVDPSCKLLGYNSSFPVYISSCALGRLAHPEAEVALTKAAGEENVIQLCPTLASCSIEEMCSARRPGQVQFFQLYVNSDPQVTRSILRRAEVGGCKAVFVTVDAPQLGRREKDMKNKFEEAGPSLHQLKNRSKGVAGAISSFIDPKLNWKDLEWIGQATSLPIVLKGIQCGEDAILAYQHGVAGIVLSNHGGRQLDYARAGIDVLVEVMEALRSVDAVGKIEVFVDGGFRRGSDIFKAIALGANGVGIGRPFLYALAAFGQDGVEKAIQLLKQEFEMCMRLMGVVTLQDIRSDMICQRAVHGGFGPVHCGFNADYFRSKL